MFGGVLGKLKAYNVNVAASGVFCYAVVLKLLARKLSGEAPGGENPCAKLFGCLLGVHKVALYVLSIEY